MSNSLSQAIVAISCHFCVADEFLISLATESQLRRLLKDELVRLHSLLPHEDEEDADEGDRLTKNELIRAILEAVSSFPPTAPGHVPIYLSIAAG